MTTEQRTITIPHSTSYANVEVANHLSSKENMDALIQRIEKGMFVEFPSRVRSRRRDFFTNDKDRIVAKIVSVELSEQNLLVTLQYVNNRTFTPDLFIRGEIALEAIVMYNIKGFHSLIGWDIC